MPVTIIHLPRPCPESWAAMTPTDAGRHCAACQKTVVDFTQKTDAEILALLTQAAGNPCGRFRRDQLGRPLMHPAAASHPTGSRWRVWLAAAVALWGVRTGFGPAAQGQVPVAHRAQATGHRAPAPAGPARLVRGTVRDAATHQPLPGVTVQAGGATHATSTDAAGRFQLWLPAGRHWLTLHGAGYQRRTVRLPAPAQVRSPLRLTLQAELGAPPDLDESFLTSGLPLVEIMEVTAPTVPIPPAVPPQPQHPRSFFRWFTRLFQPRQSGL